MIDRRASRIAFGALMKSSDSWKEWAEDDLSEGNRWRHSHGRHFRCRMDVGRSSASDLVADVAAAESRRRNRRVDGRLWFSPARSADRFHSGLRLESSASLKLTHYLHRRVRMRQRSRAYNTRLSQGVARYALHTNAARCVGNH